jgi:hypothetical protein
MEIVDPSNTSHAAPEVEQAKEGLRHAAITATHPETGVSLEFVLLGTALQALDTVLSRASQPSVAVEDAKQALMNEIDRWHYQGMRYAHDPAFLNGTLTLHQHADALIAAVRADASRASQQRIEELEESRARYRNVANKFESDKAELAARIEHLERQLRIEIDAVHQLSKRAEAAEARVSAFELKYCTADEIADADASREKDEKESGAALLPADPPASPTNTEALPIRFVNEAITELDAVLHNRRMCFAEDSDADEFLGHVTNARIALAKINHPLVGSGPPPSPAERAETTRRSEAPSTESGEKMNKSQRGDHG